LATEQGVLKKTKSLTRVRMVFSISTVLILLLMAAVPNRVDAYVLEGPHVLDLSAKAMGRIAALQVEQKLLVYPQSPETLPTVFDETAIYVMPERFRSDIASERIQRTFLVFADSSLTVIDGRTVVGENPFDIYQRLLQKPHPSTPDTHPQPNGGRNRHIQPGAAGRKGGVRPGRPVSR
jgi:hypothetical protein